MSEKSAWQGHWRVRLYERVRERGFNSLTAFAEGRPAVPMHVLADELGKEDVAAVQLLGGLLVEAEKDNRVMHFVRDVLARELADGLPDGWPAVLDDANRFKVAMALARWTSYSPEAQRERTRTVGDALLATPPPPGWRPLGPDDELLRTLLPDEET